MREIKIGDTIKCQGNIGREVIQILGKKIIYTMKSEFGNYNVYWTTKERMEEDDWKLDEPDWKPEFNDSYFRVDFTKDNFCFMGNWTNCKFEELMYKRGLIFKTEEEVIKKAKSMLEK